jgi:hypothetical protein
LAKKKRKNNASLPAQMPRLQTRYEIRGSGCHSRKQNQTLCLLRQVLSRQERNSEEFLTPKSAKFWLYKAYKGKIKEKTL